jgi:hypothetical protein
MQRHTSSVVVWLACSLLAVFAVPGVSAQTNTVRCESQGGNRQQCAIQSGARVELTRHLSDTPCRENSNWGVGEGYIWVSGGCRAEFSVIGGGYGSPSQGNASANDQQLKACRIEAGRRMPTWSSGDIRVQAESREGSIARVRWWAGDKGGLCTVAANGRILQFTSEVGGGPPPDVGAGGGEAVPGMIRVTCESQNGERKQCPLPERTRSAEVRLVRQLSASNCRLNDTYGTGPGYVWVAKGCRGEFEVSREGGVSGGTVTQITCQSTVNSRKECAIPSGAQVRLVRERTTFPCRPNDTYGTGTSYVWVSRGCGGDFEVTQGGGFGTPGARTVRMLCQSQGTGREQCRLAGATDVRLIRQMSASPCRLNESFGLGAGYMWTSNGCRGEFELTLGNTQTGVGGGAGGGNPTGLPDNVTCESKGGERTECRIRNGGQVRLARQLSTAPCIMNSTWGNAGSTLWVTKGCRGEFEVR